MKVSIRPPATPALRVEHSSFMLVGMMRSGSNFLERQLNLLPSVRCHGELFNPKFIGFAAGLPDPYIGYRRNEVGRRSKDSVAFTNEVMKACDRPLCGFRMFLDHDPVIMSEAMYNPAIKKVVLTRNLLDSFVSLLIARQTDVWLTTKAAKPEDVERVHVDPDELIQFALRQSLFYNDVLTILQRTGQPFFQIDYTEVKDLAQLNLLAEFLGVPERFSEVTEVIRRQNPAPRREKILNFDALMETLRQRSMARWFV